VAWIERLRIGGLRNLGQVDISLGQSDSWFVGANGAGKTTLLESVYLLSRGASFRGRRHGPLTSRGQAVTRIDGVAHVDGRLRRLTWRSSGGKPAAGERLAFPVRLVGSSMHALLEGEPALRRRFVDWVLFHVEPRFASVRARFRRAAAQRNAWLRSGGRGPAIWNSEYGCALGEIAALRETLFQELRRAFREIAGQLDVLPGVDPVWRAGLPAKEDLMAALERHQDADVTRGFSFLSPSRADFGFVGDGVPWVGSRGQNKLAGIALQLAADAVIRRSDAEPAVWLVDDPAAELDRDTELRVLLAIRAVAGQMLVASLEQPPVLPAGSRREQVFHVKHGVVTPLPPRPATPQPTS
jgi:DNA replication and repair protein RecF